MQILRFTARLTGYYPDPSPLEGGYYDNHYNSERGAQDDKYKELHRLHTLQGFVNNQEPFVSVAADNIALPYGTTLFIPSFTTFYAKLIIFRVVDSGNAFKNTGTSRLDICTLDLFHSVDNFLNASHIIEAILP